MYMLQESGTRVISVFRCEKRLLNWHVEWRNPRRHDSTYEVKNNNKQKKKKKKIAIRERSVTFRATCPIKALFAL